MVSRGLSIVRRGSERGRSISQSVEFVISRKEICENYETNSVTRLHALALLLAWFFMVMWTFFLLQIFRFFLSKNQKGFRIILMK